MSCCLFSPPLSKTTLLQTLLPCQTPIQSFSGLLSEMATHLKFWFVRKISILARNFLFPFRKNPMSDEPWQLVLQQLNYKLWWSLVVQIVWPLVFHHLFLHSTRDPTNMPKGVSAEMLCIFQNEDIVGASLIQRTL